MATWQTTGAHLVGPTGPKGDTGNTGSTGAKGDTGDTGPAGPMWASAYTLPYASTITPNCNNGYDQRCTLTGSPTIALATNPTDTQDLYLWFFASGADRTVTFNSSYEVSQPVPGRVFTVASGTWGLVKLKRRSTTWVIVAAYPQPVAAAPSRQVVQLRSTGNTTSGTTGSPGYSCPVANTWYNVLFPVEDYDDLGAHSTSSATDRITFTTPGRYRVSGTAMWAASTTANGTRGMHLIINGTQISGGQNLAPYLANIYCSQNVTPIVITVTQAQITAGTAFMQMQVYSSTANSNLFGSSADGCVMSAEYLDAG